MMHFPVEFHQQQHELAIKSALKRKEKSDFKKSKHTLFKEPENASLNIELQEIKYKVKKKPEEAVWKLFDERSFFNHKDIAESSESDDKSISISRRK